MSSVSEEAVFAYVRQEAKVMTTRPPTELPFLMSGENFYVVLYNVS